MSKTKNTYKSSKPADRLESDEWSLDYFERWIRVGVESFILDDLGPAAFPEAAHHILNTGSLSVGLRKFAAGLNAKRLDNMKRAVARALSSLEPQERYVPIVEQLLAIAVEISAYPVLEILAQKIGGGFFGQSSYDMEERDSLFAMTLYSVASLAKPGRREDAGCCLIQMIESENFKPVHASTALIALCEIDPRGLSRHLSAPGLRAKLADQFSNYDHDGIVKRNVANKIFSILGLTNLVNALYDLDALNPSISGAADDDWLTESLIFSSDGMLESSPNKNSMKLCLRNAPTDCVVLDRRPVEINLHPISPNEPPGTDDDLGDKSASDLYGEISERWNIIFSGYECYP